MELEQNQAEFRKLGLGAAAISYDSSAILKDFAARRGIRYPLLSDADSALIRTLGIFNYTVPRGNMVYGVPHPGVFVLDAQGVITGKYFEDDFKQRYTSADILVRQFGLTAPAGRSEVTGKQLALVSGASNSVVRPLQRVALSLEVDLQPRMHVYAPGVKGYIPIQWTMKESNLATPYEVAFPQSEDLHLKAINETVPVFQGKFRLSRDITVGTDAAIKAAVDASGNFTVEGTLRYQACDDKTCYIPQDMPVKWTFQYEAFDRERSPAEIQHR